MVTQQLLRKTSVSKSQAIHRNEHQQAEALINATFSGNVVSVEKLIRNYYGLTWN